MGSTCGFNQGNLTEPRTANSGYDCTVDSAAGLWGFCTTTITAISDCGLPGYCIDSYNCTSGCGPSPNDSGITTLNCASGTYCSILVSNNGQGGLFDWVACGAQGPMETLYPGPISATTTSSVATSSTLSPASSSTTIAGPTSMTTTTTTATTSSSSTPPPSPSSSTSYVGPVIGAILGGLAIICLTILAVFLLRRKRANSLAYDRDSGHGERYSAQPLVKDSYHDAPKTSGWGPNPHAVEMDANVDAVELPTYVATPATHHHSS